MKKNNSFILIASVLSIFIILSCMSDSVGTAVSSDGVEISYHKKGKGKPALVFVHGWTNNKTIWDSQVAHFSEKYKVVTIDLAGHEASGNNRNKWSMTAFRDDVVAVIHKLKLKQVVLVGFSLGGPVTIEVANKVPGLIDGVILVDAINDIAISSADAIITEGLALSFRKCSAPFLPASP